MSRMFSYNCLDAFFRWRLGGLTWLLMSFAAAVHPAGAAEPSVEPPAKWGVDSPAAR